MFKVDNETKRIDVTRGDIGGMFVTAINELDGTDYTFVAGDVVRLKVFEKKDCNCVVLQKDFVAEEGSTMVEVSLESEDTKIGGIISKEKEYWYEVELNPETAPQTIICYDKKGPKLFVVYPEGSNINE